MVCKRRSLTRSDLSFGEVYVAYSASWEATRWSLACWLFWRTVGLWGAVECRGFWWCYFLLVVGSNADVRNG